MSIDPLVLSEAVKADLENQVPSLGKGLGPDATYREFAAHSLVTNLLKKFKGVVAGDADQRALDKFLTSNLGCKEWSPGFQSTAEELMYGQFKKRLYDFFYPQGEPLVSCLSDLLEVARVGPGSSVGARGESLYAKLYASPLTVTRPVLYETYYRWLQNKPLHLDAELNRIQEYGEFTLVDGSRLTFVPKNSTISRVICVEPSLNMYFQLGLESILLSRLRQVYRIDLEDQSDYNRELAEVGSREDSFATIDLSSASDSISLKMLEAVMPSDILSILKTIRSPKVEIRGELQELWMVSSMGNGSTFPLETILFTCVVAAIYDINGLKPIARRRNGDVNFAVFGDDIICHRYLAKQVIRLLEILGFVVNSEKTFVEGPFRESCGADFFRGLPVRPVFIKDLSTQGLRYTAINLLNRWSSQTGLFLPSAQKLLLRSVKRNYVPLDENWDSGICVDYSFLKRPKRDRNGSIVYYRYVPTSSSYKVGDMSIKSPKGRKHLIYNPEGLFLSYLHGSVRGGRIPVRLNSYPFYRAKYRVTHNWDCSEATLTARWGTQRRRLTTALYINLIG